MNVLDSLYSTPIDALVLDHVALGLLHAVNNLWTWLAVVTAAVSLWRLRSSSAPSSPSTSPPPSVQIPRRDSSSSLSSSVASGPVTEKGTVRSRNIAERPISPISDRCSDCDGVTKGKFRAAYYKEEEEEYAESERVNCNRNEEVTEEEEEEEEVAEEWWRSWEMVLRVRTGEAGWYKCQDLTTINGNVVRLWDDVKRGGSCRRNYNTVGGFVDCGYTSPCVIVW